MAAGANKLVLEVTCGKGAFMKNRKKAEELSKIMKEIGKLSGIETNCVITNMDEPIGKTIGNSLEIEETVQALKGNMEEDVKEIVLELASRILKLAGVGENLEENKKKAITNIENRQSISKISRTNRKTRWRYKLLK